MKLALARDIGYDCGLSTDAECIANIELHATSLFDYKEMEAEIKELYDELPNSKEILADHWRAWNKRNGGS